MKIAAIKSPKEYKNALALIEQLWDAKPNTPKGDMLEVLTILVEAYEREHYPVLPPDPVEAIKFRMEQRGLSQKDIAPFLGGGNRVSEILHKKRKLTIAMIQNLHEKLEIPFESLLASPPAL